MLRFRRLATLLAAAPAQAQPGNAVVFGDSYTAMPDQFYNHYRSSSLSSDMVPADYPRASGGCLQSPHNWPRKMARQTGVPVVDRSCTAETSRSMLGKIDAAIREGDLTGGTRAVYLAIGVNDWGPFGRSEGADSSNVPSMTERFSHNLSIAAAKIRSVAPGARIIVAGMLEVTNGTGLCPIQVIPNLPLGIPVPGHQVENNIREMQRVGAERNGMIFVDYYAMTRGHNTCAPDASRYIAGVIDFTSPGYTMSLHPTDLGNEVLARNNGAAML
ncbi:MAG: GDSL-type esterase/lipase family protein [Corynebacterium sp.]|uniref:GDSL-type esterase/lipase family protein n=1 Tax=Corynebacterium sp. TaxID=1720 RepID=UPI0026DF6F50|nr:GDSL-type esterase/lipase family protein [Corynebacterium sp.]MDO5668963.1 GDSL-type esterase/lipase family protein [Corynebacterium sp.]